MPLIDLSPRIGPASPHWPGDHGFTRESRWGLDRGDSVDVATVTTTGHIGAHIDAPSHVLAGAETIEHTPLEACFGSCVVVDVSALIDRDASPHGYAAAADIRERLLGSTPADAESAQTIERVLLRHRPSGPAAWDTESPGIDPEFVRWFGSQGGLLIGIDLDSFDPLANGALPAHRAAIAAGIVMLEGLDLSKAPEGEGDLSALPIHWSGVDAAPVRAVLRVPRSS